MKGDAAGGGAVAVHDPAVVGSVHVPYLVWSGTNDLCLLPDPDLSVRGSYVTNRAAASWHIGLIIILRLLFTPGEFSHAKWSNGVLSRPFCVVAFLWNGQ
jgi:hypothetical protein